MASGRVAPGAGALEQRDHFSVERRKIIGLATGDQLLVDDDFIVHPIGAGVLRSVLSDGQEVICRPRAAPASRMDQGPWQIDATGLPASKKALTNATAFGAILSESGFMTPPGKSRASKSSGLA